MIKVQFVTLLSIVTTLTQVHGYIPSRPRHLCVNSSVNGDLDGLYSRSTAYIYENSSSTKVVDSFRVWSGPDIDLFVPAGETNWQFADWNRTEHVCNTIIANIN